MTVTVPYARLLGDFRLPDAPDTYDPRWARELIRVLDLQAQADRQPRYLWNDMVSQAIAQNLDTTSGRIDFDYDELTINYENNARYPEEPLGVVNQLSHMVLEGARTFGAHVHWAQEEDADPNFLLEWRYYNNGEIIPAVWTKALPDQQRVFTYTSGTLAQITSFVDIEIPDVKISGFLDCKLYRDTTNASTLFAGADGYSTPVRVKSFDVHVQYDSLGSATPFSK